MPASQRLRRAHGSRREIPFLPRRQSYQRFRRAFWSAAGAADTSASSCSFLSWCDSAMSQALTDCESPDPPLPPPPPSLTRPQEPNPICSGPPAPPTVWKNLSRVPGGRQRQDSPHFLLHNSISSNQRRINQRHLIQSEWI